MKVQMIVRTKSGAVFPSKLSDATAVAVASLQDYLKLIGELEYLTLEVDGGTVGFEGETIQTYFRGDTIECVMLRVVE
jgi:hypothetical protein